MLPPPVEPPASLLYQGAEPLPEFDEMTTTEVDLVKRIHELTARLANAIIEHRGLSEFVLQQHQSYRRFYEEQDHE